MVGLLGVELFKLTRYALVRWLGLALLALVLLRGLVWPPAPEVPWAGLWSFTLVATALILLTAVTVGTEFSEDTFRSLISRGVPRAWLLLAKLIALMLVGGVLLVAIEGVATLLRIRQELHWGDLGRAWLSLWPYASLVMLLTVLARNGGLALVVGVIWIALEQFAALMIGGMVMLAEFPEFQWITHQGIAGTVYQWSLSYNSANWTYLSQYQRAPMPLNVLLWAMPHSAAQSALVLAAGTLLSLGLSILIVHRRDVTEVVPTKNRLFHLAKHRTHPVKGRGLSLPGTRMSWIDKRPLLVRLTGVHLFRIGRTSLVRIGLLVSLLFPFALWGLAKALAASGFEDSLFGAGPQGNAPLAIVFSLMVLGPLATVVAILAVGNELSLGTRRAELTRGVSRVQAITTQSLALVLSVGGLFALLMMVVLVLGAGASGSWPLSSAVLSILVAILATGAYVGAIQMGGALTRSPLGATLFGLGFLVADWFAILAPTLTRDGTGPWLELGRYTVFANTVGLSTRGQTLGLGIEWPYLSWPTAVLLLLAYAVASHLLAALFARWRDA